MRRSRVTRSASLPYCVSRVRSVTVRSVRRRQYRRLEELTDCFKVGRAYASCAVEYLAEPFQLLTSRNRSACALTRPVSSKHNVNYFDVRVRDASINGLFEFEMKTKKSESNDNFLIRTELDERVLCFRFLPLHKIEKHENFRVSSRPDTELGSWELG